jgi:MacB-like periplasmic core domain
MALSPRVFFGQRIPFEITLRDGDKVRIRHAHDDAREGFSMSMLSCLSVRCFHLKFVRFALMAVLALAAGMNAKADECGMTNIAWPDWLPRQHAGQLFYLRVPTGAPDGATNTGGETTSFSLPVFEALRGDGRTFSDVMAYAPLGNGKVSVHESDISEMGTGEMVSGNFFSGLGVRMMLGDGFKMEDERRHTPVVVLSFAYWAHLYLRNPCVAGQTIYIQGVPFAILGVTPEGFSGVEPGRPTDFWIPLQSRPDLTPWGSGQTLYGSPNWWCLRLIARLAPGVDAQRAVVEATPRFQTAAYARLSALSAEQPKVALALVPAMGVQGVDVSGVGAREGLHGWMLILMAMAGLLLLTVCGYVAMRMRARAGRIGMRAS